MLLNKKNCAKFGLRKIEGPKDHFCTVEDKVEGEFWHRYGKASGSSLYEYSKEYGVYVQQWKSCNGYGWQEEEHLSIVISPAVIGKIKGTECRWRLSWIIQTVYDFNNYSQTEDTIQPALNNVVNQIKLAIEESTEYWGRICAEVEAEKEAVS